MKSFMVLYLVPSKVIEDWSKTDPAVRKDAEGKMQAEWGRWMGDHAAMIRETSVGGKTRRVDTNGTTDVKNDIMLYSFIEAESHEDAARAFERHPHLQIPQSSIEIMEVRPMSGG